MVAETGHSHYVPRTILITGGAGFIASHVATRLALKYPEYQARTLLCCTGPQGAFMVHDFWLKASPKSYLCLACRDANTF